MARPRKNPIPNETDIPEPEQSPMLGDLTPEYVLWFKQTHSREEFIERYSDRIPTDYPETHQIEP